MLSERQIDRYSRQIILPQLGGRGQEALLSASVAVVGNGSLSATTALYLAAAGVGRLVVPRAEAPALANVNPDCGITTLPDSMTSDAAASTVRTCDVVVAGGTDDATCTVWNAACVAHHTPLVWADAHGSIACLGVFAGPALVSCYTCLRAQLHEHLAHGEQVTALAAATSAFIGTLQVTETLKLLLGADATPLGRLLSYDACAGTVSEQRVARDPACATCGACT